MSEQGRKKLILLVNFVARAYKLLVFATTKVPSRHCAHSRARIAKKLLLVFLKGHQGEDVEVHHAENYFKKVLAKNHDGDVLTSVLTFSAGDLTDQRNLQDKLEKARKDEFMSTASHELKTPLTSLKLRIQLRKILIDDGRIGEFTEAKIRKMIEDDERQVNRLVALIDKMLDMWQII